MSENYRDDEQDAGNISRFLRDLEELDRVMDIDPYESYGSVNSEDNLGHLIALARSMSAADELLVVAEILGMTPLQLLMTLADMQELFSIIAMPVLPPIALIIIDDMDAHTDNPGEATSSGPYVQSIIDQMNDVARGIPPLTPPTFGTGHSAMREIADKVAERHPFDELAARRTRQSRTQFDQMATGELFRHTPNPDTVFNPLEASFAHGMVHRSMLFGQLIALGNTDLAPDADPEATRAADLARAFVYGRRRAEELLDPYVETPQEPGSTDPQE
jgi:hypothetical protein